MLTFKQYLAELMVDIKDDDTPQDAQNRARHTQMINKRAPQRVARDQLNQAQKDLTAASSGSSPTKAVDTNIARKKEELARLEQQKIAQKKNTTTTPGSGPVPAGM